MFTLTSRRNSDFKVLGNMNYIYIKFILNFIYIWIFFVILLIIISAILLIYFFSHFPSFKKQYIVFICTNTHKKSYKSCLCKFKNWNHGVLGFFKKKFFLHFHGCLHLKSFYLSENYILYYISESRSKIMRKIY